MANKILPDIYFKGRAKLKFCSQNTGESNQDGMSSFSFAFFYDVIIHQLEEIDYFNYKGVQSHIRAKNKLEFVHLDIDGKRFKVEVKDLILLGAPKIYHEQFVNNELLGEIKEVEVYIRIPSKASKQENISTGNRKTEDHVIYEEFYTNEGKLEWRVIKAPKGKLTGRVQKKEELFRYEQYNNDGSTYWSSWVERKDFLIPKNIKTGPTDLKRRGQKQILTEDHKFIWVKDNSPRENSILINLIVIGVLFVFFGFIYFLSFQYEGEVIVQVVLPIMLGFFILVPVINVSLKLMNRSRKYIIQYNWLALTIICTGFTLLLFSTSMVGAINEFCKNRRYVSYTSKNKQLSFGQNDHICVFKQQWTDFHTIGRPKYNLVISTNCEVFCDCEVGFNSDNLSTRYIHSIRKADKHWSKEKQELISQIKQQNGIGKKDNLAYLNALFSMVQSRPYAKIHEKNLVKDFVSPVHFLFGLNENDVANFTGDCDTRTLALFFLLKDDDEMDVAIFNFESPDPKRFPHHSMIGIASENLKVESKNHIVEDGKKYYLWETTARYKIGRMAPQYSDLKRWELKLSEDAFN